MVTFSFARPEYLLFLFIIPLLILIHFLTLKGVKSKAIVFANFEALSRIKGVDFFSKNIVILFFSVIIVFFLSLSLAQVHVNALMTSSDYPIVLAIDTSQSMSANDIPPSRLEATKKIIIEVIDSSPVNARFGIVSFSGNALIESEITNDKSALEKVVREIQLSQVGGTDIYNAVSGGINLFPFGETGAIILFSDGQMNVGTLEETISYALKRKIVINTVAVGTVSGGEASYGLSRLNEKSLQALAYNTKGKYYFAKDEGKLSDSLKEITGLGKKIVSIDLSNYLIIFSIILFLILYLLWSFKYRSVP